VDHPDYEQHGTTGADLPSNPRYSPSSGLSESGTSEAATVVQGDTVSISTSGTWKLKRKTSQGADPTSLLPMGEMLGADLQSFRPEPILAGVDNGEFCTGHFYFLRSGSKFL